MTKPSHPFKELPVATRPELAALYQRLGNSPLERETKLAQILLEFYEVISRDVLLGFFFDAKDLRTIAMRQKQFLMRAMGASTSYPGKPPAQAHQTLAPILSGHFDRRLVLLGEVLRKHGLSEADIATWLGFENTFREGIVQKNEPSRKTD